MSLVKKLQIRLMVEEHQVYCLFCDFVNFLKLKCEQNYPQVVSRQFNQQQSLHINQVQSVSNYPCYVNIYH